MPPKSKKETEDKITIKRFPDRSSEFWCNYSHYRLTENNEIEFVAGGYYQEEYAEALRAFIKRNKVTYAPREKSLFEQEETEYSIVTFGKYSGKSTIMIVAEDVSYARWIYEKTTDKKIKQELKILLKK